MWGVDMNDSEITSRRNLAAIQPRAKHDEDSDLGPGEENVMIIILQGVSGSACRRHCQLHDASF